MPTIGASTRIRPLSAGGGAGGGESLLLDDGAGGGADDALRRLRRPADGDAEAGVLDRHLAHARVLDDADDLADALGAGRVDAAALERVLAARGRGSSRSSGSASSPNSASRSSSSSLAASPCVLLAQLVEVGHLGRRRRVAGDELDRPRDGGSISRRAASP